MKRGRKSRDVGRNVVSLFSGAMGLDLGLESAGFRVRVALEINKAAIETIELNRPRMPLIKESIQDTTTREILRKARLRKDQVSVLSAGPCCHPFSTAGKRHSVSDERGSLFRDFCGIVRDVRPRFFVMENVKGILSAAIKHRRLDERGPGFPPLTKKEQFGSALVLIRKELAKLNYYVVFGLLNSAEFGVPQRRWRVFFIGSRDGEDIELPSATHFNPRTDTAKDGLGPWLTLRQALKGVQAKNWSEFSKDRLKLLQRLKPGQDWRDLPVTLHEQALGAALKSWGGRTGFCRRLSWDEPSPTLMTAPDGRATTLCHPTKDRPLSVEEYAALQQFPKGWKFAGSIAQRYVQIGNAVPVGLGEAIGRMLRSTMRKTARGGLSRINYLRRGTVVCGDTTLEGWLKNRKKTQLHPPRLRKVKSLEAARKWLLACA